MVGIVVVSHSDALAQGVVTLAREMSPPELMLEAAGGIGEEGILGTSAELIGAAIARAMSAQGVLVLMDLGSALMSAELAVELLEGASGPVRLSAAPLVEGTIAAAAAAGGGATLDEVAAEAGRALEMKSAQLGPDDVSATRTDAAEMGAAGNDAAGIDATRMDAAAVDAATVAPTADAEAELAVENEVGLHARPAARLVETVRRYDAEVLVAKAGSGGPPVSARSLTNVVALSARRGDSLRVLANGPQAGEVLAALRELAADGFGDGLATLVSAPPTEPPAAPAPGTELRGVPACAGLANGPARVLAPATAAAARAAGGPAAGGPAAGGPAAGGPAAGGPPVGSPAAGSPDQELESLERGIEAARAAITADRERLRASTGDDEAEIFDAHLALLDDEALLAPARRAVAAGASAEDAAAQAAAQVSEIYRRLDNPLLAERAVDVLDVGRRIAAGIRSGANAEASAATSSETSSTADAKPPSSAEQNDNDSHSQILVAEELTPSEAAGLDRDRIAGIATARGSATAHAAIIARALGIPAVVGLGDAILAILPGTPLLLDGSAGTVVVSPEAELLDAAAARARADRARRSAAAARSHERGRMASGERIEVFANIGSAADAQAAVEHGAEGVGLLRTEFLFLDRAELPDEDEQRATLREIADALDGRPLIVRTLDAGADKPLPGLPLPAEANPFLGVRGIRVGLRNPELLSTQLRAVLRVAAERPLKLMLPMVASPAEVVATRELLDRARAETGVTAGLELGIMVEVPAAALTSAALAAHVDFLSIGTNDLTQYTMAAERGNARLEPLLAGPQPAVLQLVRTTVEAARAHGRWVGVCGELAGDPPAAVLLAGLGVTELSMAPGLIPEIKQALRGVELPQARAAAAQALRATSAEQAREYGLALLR